MGGRDAIGLLATSGTLHCNIYPSRGGNAHLGHLHDDEQEHWVMAGIAAIKGGRMSRGRCAPASGCAGPGRARCQGHHPGLHRNSSGSVATRLRRPADRLVIGAGPGQCRLGWWPVGDPCRLLAGRDRCLTAKARYGHQMAGRFRGAGRDAQFFARGADAQRDATGVFASHSGPGSLDGNAFDRALHLPAQPDRRPEKVSTRRPRT